MIFLAFGDERPLPRMTSDRKSSALGAELARYTQKSSIVGASGIGHPIWGLQ